MYFINKMWWCSAATHFGLSTGKIAIRRSLWCMQEPQCHARIITLKIQKNHIPIYFDPCVVSHHFGYGFVCLLRCPNTKSQNVNSRYRLCCINAMARKKERGLKENYINKRIESNSKQVAETAMNRKSTRSKMSKRMDGRESERAGEIEWK